MLISKSRPFLIGYIDQKKYHTIKNLYLKPKAKNTIKILNTPTDLFFDFNFGVIKLNWKLKSVLQNIRFRNLINGGKQDSYIYGETET
ncbi:hypothetical protein ACP275_06G021800 [Erythranthe tilingii]